MKNEDTPTTEPNREDQIFQLGNVMNLSFYAMNRLKQLSPDALAELVYVFNIKPPTGV